MAEQSKQAVETAETETASATATLADLQSRITAILQEFDDLLPIVQDSFTRTGCETLFADRGHRGVSAGEEGGPRHDRPAMFGAPGIEQTIAAGATVNTLPLVCELEGVGAVIVCL